MTQPLLYATIEISELELNVATLRLREGAHLLTHVEAEVSSKRDIDFRPHLNRLATVRLVDETATQREWRLIVGAAGYHHLGNDTVRYRLSLHAPPWVLGHTLNTRKFRNMNAEAIVTAVLDEGGIAHRWELSSATEQRKFTSQYRESNLDFVLRLLEFEGIFFTIAPDGTMVFDDRSRDATPIDGDSHLELIEGASGLTREEAGILWARRGARVKSGKATVSDFNWKTPRVDLLRSADAPIDAELETYDYPEGYRRPDQGERLAALRLEAHRTDAKFFDGRSNVERLCPLRTFAFGGPWSGEFLLCHVEHQFRDSRFDEDNEDEPLVPPGITYQNEFSSIPRGVPFRPAKRVPRPVVQGCHTVTVRGPAGEEIHTDKYGRFRAQFHWDRDATGTDDDSRWLRKLQESATSMNLARVGWEVSAAYIDGDPDRPIGLARNINGVMTPTYGQPGNKEVMTIHTPSSPATGGFNEIKLDDKAGSQLFYVQAEKDHNEVVENDRNENIANDDTQRFHDQHKVAVKRDQRLEIGVDRSVTVKVDQVQLTEGDRTRVVGGNDSLEADMFQRNIIGNDSEVVGGNKITTTGTVVTPSAQSLGSMVTGGFSATSLGSGAIMRASEKRFTRNVGAIQALVSLSSISRDTTVARFETIGGAKLTVAATGSIETSVQGPMAHTVGAAEIRLSGAQMGIAAENCNINVGALANFSSAEKTSIEGRTITVTALGSLTFMHGATEITLSPGAINIKGELDLDAGEKVVMTGKDDNLSAG